MGPQYALLFLTTVFLATLAQQQEYDKKVYCGKQLSSTLSTVCKGNYNTLNKKSNIYQKKNYWDAQFTDYQADAGLVYPYISKATATTLMSQFRRRKKRGVYNECCEKACSYEELMSYCAVPGRKR